MNALSNARPNTLFSVQYLRALAATLVILAHAFAEIPRSGGGDLPDRFTLGTAGVDIFFVISGFLMVFITQDREKTAGNFLYHRLVRIAPPYWAVTLLMGILVYFAPHLFHSSSFDGPHFLASFAFLAWPNPILKDAWPIYHPGWTLNYEFFFYLIFSVFIFLPMIRKIACLSIALLSLVLFGMLFPFENSIYEFYTTPIMVEFAFGAILAGLVILNPALPRYIAFGLIALGAVLLVGMDSMWKASRHEIERLIAFGLPATMLVAGFIYAEFGGWLKKIDSFRFLGDASYATYLTHLFVIGAVSKTWKMLSLKDHFHDIFLVVVCLVGSWIGGIIFHLCFEKPAIRIARNLTSKYFRKPNASLAAER